MANKVQFSLLNQKNQLWKTASAVIVSLFGLGNYNAIAQEKPVRENIYSVIPIPDRKGHGIETIGRKTINGVVGDAADSLSLSNVKLYNKNTSILVKTTNRGCFNIKAMAGDSIEITLEDYKSRTIIYNGNNLDQVLLQK